STDTIWGWTQQDGWERPDGFVEGILGVATVETVYRKRYVGKEVGYYVVDVTTDASGNALSATFISDLTQCCTGIEEVIAADGNVLFPNPTNGSVQVRTGGDIYQLEIMDMSGKLLQSTQLTVDGQTVQLDGLASGLYIYRMIEENGNVAHTGRLSYID
ncbi:MAG: T9SS type A sorting domain-containing protein, partial [Flavobacteriales bacterium]|nr:T9SS type A sorting domain-containing protein [Flavobacteriales bacterium]